MRRDEVEAVAKKIEGRADAREQEGASEWHEAEGMRIAVTMLREALAKSEAAPVPEPGTKTLLLPAVPAFEMTFSGVAMSTGIEIVAFGPGLWIVETVERSESDPKMAHVTAYPVSP